MMEELNEPQAQYGFTPKQKEIEEDPIDKRVSLDEYLDMIADGERRLEYHDGQVIDIQSATEQHGLICTNLTGLIYICTRNKDCSVYAGDRELWIEESNQMFYPDLIIVFGKHEMKKMSKIVKATINPTIVIEVSSELIEDGHCWYKKKRFYKKMKSIQQLIYVSQDEKYIEVSNRTSNDRVWKVIEYFEDDENIPIGDCNILLKDIYERVEFENQPERAIEV